ncbi:MAG TPA: MarR family transcriptional regulator [Acidimicrobiales bacterium]|nr:MarR family transcriptional regulator [Acidimicrobiales bacterium]
MQDSDDLVDAVLRASRALVAVAARSIAQVDDAVTLPQYRALVALAAHGSQRVTDLADELGVHSSSVTRMCDRLERAGFIDRSVAVGNRREVEVRLSRRGRALLDRVTTARRREIARVVKDVPKQLREAMVEGLQTFSDAAGEVPDQAWAAGWDTP